MEILLQNLEFWQILILLLIILISIFGILFTIFVIIKNILKNKIKFKTKNNSIELNSDENLDQTEEINSSKKIEVSDMSLLIEKITSITMKKAKIILRDILSKQMHYTDQKLIKIKGKLQNEYLVYLRNKLNSNQNLVSNEDYKFYTVLLDLFFSRELNSYLIECYKQNSIPTPIIDQKGQFFENPEWINYVNTKYDTILQKLTDFLNDNYISNKRIVSREEIHEFTYKEETLKEIKIIIEDIFKKIYDIQYDYIKDLTFLDEDLKKSLENFIH